MNNVIFTDQALSKMRDLAISEAVAIDTFNKGTPEKWSNGAGYNSVRKYNGYEIGVAYYRDSRGFYKITTVWKRVNRR